MAQPFQFLCGNNNNINFVYATKFGNHSWHYFEEQHSISDEHDSLHRNLNAVIKKFKRPRVIEILLDEEQVKNYYDNGKFIFKNTELQTFITLENVSTVQQPIKRSGPTTKNLMFESGVTNPLLFLADFEKCIDVKTTDDKLEKIRHFVDEEHKAEFSQLRFANDWTTAKTRFLTTYSLPFIENRKNDMNFNFYEEHSLRSFVARKLEMLTKYTTLSPLNQMDVILNELPTDIAHLFIVNGKFDCPKDNILDFCDSIDEVSEKFKHNNQPIQDIEIDEVDEPLNNMVQFRYDPDVVEPQPSTSRGVRRKAKGRVSHGKIVKTSRQKKSIQSTQDSENESDTDTDTVLETIEEENRDFDVDRVSATSESTFTSKTSKDSSLSRTSGQSRYFLRHI